MSTATAQPTSELRPFFEDSRSVLERLNAERRDWIPTKPKSGSPELLAGLVLDTGTYTGLNDKVSPTLRILDAESVEWSVIGFHGFLRAEIARQKPRVGDWVAIAYTGTKPATKPGESDSFTYRLIVERNPSVPFVPSVSESDPAPSEPAGASAAADDDIPF